MYVAARVEDTGLSEFNALKDKPRRNIAACDDLSSRRNVTLSTIVRCVDLSHDAHHLCMLAQYVVRSTIVFAWLGLMKRC